MIEAATHEAWFDSGKADAPPPKVDQRVNSSLGRRLLEQLRGQVVEGWRDCGVPDTELLPLLVAMERVRVAIEPSWAQTFAQNLSGSDGLALLMDVAHDLRSPLTSILVLAETLQRGQSGPVSDVQRRQLGLIYTAALGLSSVASDIIEFTQGGDQLVDQEPTVFSVTAMLESVGDIVRPIAEEKHLTVRLLAPTHDERKGHPVALSRTASNSRCATAGAAFRRTRSPHCSNRCARNRAGGDSCSRRRVWGSPSAASSRPRCTRS
jgi:signal transduction histidine kinase